MARSIPTHVGKPGIAFGSRCFGRVYPHSRGETTTSVCLQSYQRGLSPLTWGNPFLLFVHGFGLGSIPTHVGKPPSTWLLENRSRVYPHSRGETIIWVLHLDPIAGLSPLTWGNHHLGIALGPYCRSIPTHVGKP